MRSEINLGIVGAIRATWFGDGYRSIIRELAEKYPRADEDRIAKLFAERLESDADLRLQVSQYATANAMRSLHRAKARAGATKFSLAAIKPQIDAAAAHIQSQVLLLNMEMPNGKRLRYCDGYYVAKLGGGLARAGRKAGKKLMGQVFDEKSLRTAMGLAA